MISLMQILNEAQGNPKAILLAGAPGAGKGTILRQVDLKGLPIFNLDDTIIALSKAKDAGFTLDQKTADAENRSRFMRAMQAATKDLKTNQLAPAIAQGKSFVLDGTSSSYNTTNKLKQELEDQGYQVMMLYVYTDLERSLRQNQDRFEKSGGQDRSLAPGAVLRTWNDVTKQYFPYKELFGNNFVSVANTGEDNNLKDVESILQKYVEPFAPKDAKPKDAKAQARSDKQKAQVNQEIQDFLDQDKVKDITANSVSAEEAASKIQSFLS